MLAGLSLINKLLYGSAVVVILSLAIALFFADRRADKWEAKAVKCGATLTRLAEESKANQAEVKERIVEGRERVVYVDRVARGIESAPLPGNCKTPVAVLGADL
jgi:cell division protein FtsL